MGTVPRFILVLQLLAALVLTAARAGAEAPKEPPEEGARAKLLLRANEAMRDGRFAEARDAFLAIWEASAEHDAACNVGRLSYRIDDMPRAVEFLTLCISYGSNEAEIGGARLELAQARRQVAEVRVRGPAGTEVSIDGHLRGRAPIVAYLVPGVHVISGRRAPDLSAEKAITVGAGEARIVQLEPTTPPRAPRASDRIIIAGAAVSATLLGVGGALTVAAYIKESEGDDSTIGPNGCYDLSLPRCADAPDSYALATKLRNVAAVGFLAGGVAATATLSYTLWPRSALTVTAAGSGIAVRGTW